MAIDLILFDLDGTLIDSGRDLCTAVNAMRAELSCAPLEQSVVRAAIGDGARKLIERCLPEPPPVPVDEALDRFRAAYAEHLLDTTRPYPGIDDLLARLKQPMAVVSNKPERFTRTLVEAFGWGDRIRPVLGGDSCTTRKPEPEMLLAACAVHGVEPQGAAMVGDGPQDVRAGRAAGTRICAVTWGFCSREELARLRPDRLADQVAELAGWLDGEVS